ncbi:MAG: sporulation integral membrane protein YlbJ [Firmicutes bacterium]|nr:sporulation integral membrane protein YlbJ [Bacillota bacterium]
MKTNFLTKERMRAYLPAALAVGITVSMVFFPEEAFGAAVKGLEIWWHVVFPALLPFFIGSELLMGLGVVHGLGVLLEPLMRPLFRVPGEGSFVMAMGLASGYPIGAILSARLRRDGICTKTEGERLMSFTNTADPLFMSGAVAVGMLGLPQVGFTIMAAHYLSSITTGLFLRFYGKNEPQLPEKRTRDSILGRAVNALYTARQNDGRNFGELMGDAIRNSINSLLLVGGFIILFSVIIRLFTVLGLVDILGMAAMKILGPLGLDSSLVPAIISGIFEVDLGCELVSKAPAIVPLSQKIMTTSAIIAWSGISVHGQVASVISDTDLKITPFIFARILHAVLAAAFTWLLMGPFSAVTSLPVFAAFLPQSNLTFLQRTVQMSRLFIFVSMGLLALGLVINLSRSVRVAVFRR